MKILINKLKNYGPSNPKKVKSKQEVLDNVQKLYNIRNDIVDVFESNTFFKRSNTDDITKDMSELKDKKSKQKKYSYEKWTTPIKKSNFKSIYDYVADLVNNNKVFRVNDNEVITAIPLSYFISDISNNKFNTRDNAIKYISERIYPEYESKLNLIKEGLSLK